MLIAKLSNGRQFSLINNKKFNDDVSKRHSFYCPICNQSVILKTGNTRRWHFAHKKNSSCLINQEPETAYHLEGKVQLFQWLKKQYQHVYLEYYLKSINQRPDILVKTEQGIFAIEYQCSTISEKDLMKRTVMFKKKNITPIWILGAHRLKKNKNSFSLSPMDWLTLRQTKQPFIIFYCPTKKQFILLSCLQPFSSRKTFATKTISMLSQTSFSSLVNPTFQETSVVNQWLKEKKKWRLSCHYDKSKPAQFIRNELYKRRLNMCYIPALCGIPHHHSHIIKTSSMYWQTWLVLAFLYNKKVGDSFSLINVSNAFKSLLKNHIFHARTFPCLRKEQGNISLPLRAYLEILCHFNVIKKRNEKVYSIMNEIPFPASNYEARVADEQLLRGQKNLF